MSEHAVSIVLLLGSYDKTTKTILDNVKEEIAKIFAGKTFAFLLEDLEIFTTDRFEVLAEIEDNQLITLYLFEGSSLHDVVDLPLKAGENPDEIVYGYLRQNSNISRIDKKTVAAKFSLLMSLAVEIFLVRHKEETRGGEYVELMHSLFAGQSEKVWFFKNDSVAISSMLKEYLDMFRVKMRTYDSILDLKTSILRIVGYSRAR